jgi:hypothetical protein
MNGITPAGPATLVVEPHGDILLVRLEGAPDGALLRECQRRLVELAHATGLRRVLYDVRAMLVPEADLVLMQRDLDGQSGGLRLRRALVVPGAHMAYLARLAFGEGSDRVFYDDVEEAIAWLCAVPAASEATAAQASVETEGDVVVVRVRGAPDAGLLARLQKETMEQVRASGTRRVLYDARALSPPDTETVLRQRELDDQLVALGLRRAIVVPNTRIAYLARLAFGEGEVRVFYDDTDAALRWLRADA